MIRMSTSTPPPMYIDSPFSLTSDKFPYADSRPLHGTAPSERVSPRLDKGTFDSATSCGLAATLPPAPAACAR
jgi:hypothetical protein